MFFYSALFSVISVEQKNNRKSPARHVSVGAWTTPCQNFMSNCEKLGAAWPTSWIDGVLAGPARRPWGIELPFHSCKKNSFSGQVTPGVEAWRGASEPQDKKKWHTSTVAYVRRIYISRNDDWSTICLTRQYIYFKKEKNLWARSCPTSSQLRFEPQTHISSMAYAAIRFLVRRTCTRKGFHFIVPHIRVSYQVCV